MNNWVTCVMCGTRFDAEANPACGSCPFHQGCKLACCPSCGYQSIVPQRSGLARLASRLFSGKSGAEKDAPNSQLRG